MRIGIDVDDTIVKTWSSFMPILSEKYNIPLDKIKKSEPYYDAVKDIVTMEEYIDMVKKSGHLSKELELRPYVKEVLTKLKEEGNTIIFITARDDNMYDDSYLITKEYLDRHKIPYDKIIVNAYDKGRICKEEKIDLFIDDNIKNCQSVYNERISVVLMETIFNKDNKEFIRMKDWKQIYNYINNR